MGSQESFFERGKTDLGYELPTGFVAYPSHPAFIGEIVRKACDEINKSRQVILTTWEQLRIGGKLIIGEICNAIQKRDMFVADLTELNPNVLFELGFAVAQNKRLWLTLDSSIRDAKNNFQELRLLSTVGYSGSTNHEEVVKAFFHDKPYADLLSTLFEAQIKPSLAPKGEAKILYLQSLWNTEASNDVSKRLSRSNLKCIVDDPTESAFQTLVWYAQNAYGAAGVVCHFTSLNREGARVHNARQALVCGLAFGFGRPLLMLADDDYLTPIDYRDLLRNYSSAKKAIEYLDLWLRPLEINIAEIDKLRDSHAQALELATELQDFQIGLGDYIAENEEERLPDYFVETSAYRDALEGKQTIFVGRKGTGKTANFVKLANELGKRSDNLVCPIKPVAYEIEALVRLFRGFKQSDTKGYVIESLWKFLIYTEIANAAMRNIEGRNVWEVPSEEEQELVRMMTEEGSVLSGDFAVRLERALAQLLKISEGPSIELTRFSISEALHSHVLGRLRNVIGRVLFQKNRVAVLVDNLDKPWTKQADIAELSDFLLGLLTAGSRIAQEFKKTNPKNLAVNVSLAIFMRADIFGRVLERAREADKIFYTKLSWADKELLLRVVEERYETSHKKAGGDELWKRYFCESVGGVATRDYLVSRILPRPRDLVYLVKGAVANAVNRRNSRVEENDILDAEPDYSQYAVKSILVENGVSLPQLEDIIIEFAGAPAILTSDEIEENIRKAYPKNPEDIQRVINHLVGTAFLGLEVSPEQFEYAEDYGEYRKNTVLARRLLERKNSQQRFKINPAFHPYLETPSS
jgi:hypothetical protein